MFCIFCEIEVGTAWACPQCHEYKGIMSIEDAEEYLSIV